MPIFNKLAEAISIRTAKSSFLKPGVNSFRVSVLELELYAPQHIDSLSD